MFIFKYNVHPTNIDMIDLLVLILLVSHKNNKNHYESKKALMIFFKIL
jgi:hypothetical protein